MAYHTKQKIRFKHCDPAGLVFYPRYLEMINDLVEAWFEIALGAPWQELHKTHAVPTVHIDVDFNAPSRHGDLLDLRLCVKKVGETSVSLQIEARCGGESRLVVRSTLVHTDAETMRPVPWPKPIRSRMLDEKELPVLAG